MTLLSLPEGLNLLYRRTRFARIALISYIVTSACIVVATLAEWTGTIDLETADPMTAVAVAIVYLLYVLAFIAAVVFVAVWIYRAHANLRAAGIEGLSFTPAWAVGWYFIPIATFIQPFRAMRELWSTSHGQHESFGDDADPRLKLWWGTWLSGNILAYVGTRQTLAGTPAALQVGHAVDIVSTLLLMAAAWLLAQIIEEINTAQNDGITMAQAFA